MGRRTSGQQVGLQAIGLVQANANTLTTTQSNADLNINPNGTGVVTVDTDLTILDQGDLRLREASANGTNYIAMQAAAAMSGNYTLTWPSAVSGGAGYYLASDTNGALSWNALPSGGLTSSDPGSTATAHYLLFETSAGSIPTGTLTTIKTRSNISFIPSTGILTTTGYIGATHDGSTANSGTLTLRGTSSATKATASVIMSDGVASTTTATGTLVVTGGVGISGQITATTIVETSSIAFKENVVQIPNALDSIMQLVGVTYDRTDNKEHEAGLIAEEVYKVIPDLVSLDKNGKPYGIKYTKLGAYLIESIKALKNEIAELKGNK